MSKFTNILRYASTFEKLSKDPDLKPYREKADSAEVEDLAAKALNDHKEEDVDLSFHDQHYGWFMWDSKEKRHKQTDLNDFEANDTLKDVRKSVHSLKKVKLEDYSGIRSEAADKWLKKAVKKPDSVARVSEDNLSLMVILEKNGHKRAWMTEALAEAQQLAKKPGNESWSLEDLVDVILEDWLGREAREEAHHALNLFQAFLRNRSFERQWYAQVKRDQEVVKVLRGPLHIDELDLKIYQFVRGRPKWMTWVLEDARSSFSENGKSEEWDSTNLSMVEGYVEFALAELFDRDLRGHAFDLMWKFVKSPSFEPSWYAAVEALSGVNPSE